jgi:hypothetical protein
VGTSSGSAAGVAGVAGLCRGGAPGVLGDATNGGQGSGTGVQGQSDLGVGVSGSGAIGVAGSGTGSGVGVHALAPGATPSTAQNVALLADGPVVVNGPLSVQGQAPLTSLLPTPGQLATLHWYAANQSTAFAVGKSPSAVAFDGANIWVANSGSNNVAKLRAGDGSVLGTFAVGSAPVGVAFDGASIWVANSGSNTVAKL